MIDVVYGLLAMTIKTIQSQLVKKKRDQLSIRPTLLKLCMAELDCLDVLRSVIL